MRDSQLVSSSRRRWPQLRISAPLGQLYEGHEGDQRLAADQASSKRPGERAPVQQRGDIGVQDGQVHGEGSDQVAVTLRVGEGQKLLHFLVGLEGIRGKLL